MMFTTHSTPSFPNVKIHDDHRFSPIEVNLIAQLGIGAGSSLVQSASARQSHHFRFVDALDEPSAKLGNVNPRQNDPSSLYSFVVGSHGHPFHRHAGPRMFTAISGSSGAQLRFSTVSLRAAEDTPEKFSESLYLVDIPPDCLFSVRFGGGTWHQFVSPTPESGHPTMFALSCHPDEASGLDDASRQNQIILEEASVPSLTEVLPIHVQKIAARVINNPGTLRRTSLFLQPISTSWRNAVCVNTRKYLGKLRAALAKFLHTSGSAQHSMPALKVQHLPGSNSALLNEHFKPKKIDHDDAFICELHHPCIAARSAGEILDELLTNFTTCPPQSITALMMLRNALVMPFGLRRSRLGCPVSSLKSENASERFAGKHPVLAQYVSNDGCFAEVMLGADDRHLRFRTSVSVQRKEEASVVVSLSSRVACQNLFGKLYMVAIQKTHESYVSPKLLSSAIAGLVFSNRLSDHFEVDNAMELVR